MVLVYGFPDTWDYLFSKKCDSSRVTLEINIATVLQVAPRGQKRSIRIQDWAFCRYDPRSYSGYGHYTFEGRGGAHYNVDSESVFGVLNGVVNVDDEVSIEAVLKQVIRQYRPRLERVYYRKTFEHEEELRCL